MLNLLETARAIPHGISAISEWLADGTVVDGDEAQARADVCLKCPNNVPESSVTGVVADGVRRMLEFKNKVGLRVDGEKSLGACAVCKCVLRLQVHEPAELLKLQIKNGKEVFPFQCWKNHL